MPHPEPQFVFALALGAGVLAHALARHLRVPSIVLLLAVGVVLGPDVLGWIHPEALGGGLFGLVELAVAVILFEGGLNLELGRLRRESSAIRLLVTSGAAVTALGGALAAHFFMGWSWSLSVVFGTLVIVTGPTVIRPILRNVPLRPRLATVLEAEGVLIDPIGAIVAAVTLQVVLAPAGDSFAPGVAALLQRLAFGTAAGLAFGFALGRLLALERAVPEGLGNIVTLGAVLVLSELCNEVVSESGILAVTVAGVVVGNIDTRVSRELREFQDHLTVALLGILFVLLAADVRVSEVTRLGWPGLATVAALVLLVRPANVAASTMGSELDLREKAFLCWIAPRGIVAAAVASLFAGVLDAEGMPGGAELRALVFLTIALTVTVQAGSAPLVARLLRVRMPGRDSIVVLSAEELALALGEVLRQGKVRVVFVDANPSHCHAAEQSGFPVVFGNALEERTLARARLEQARAVVGLTPNDEVNSLFAREAREEYGVREAYVSINRPRIGITPTLLEKRGLRMLFDGPKEVERWSVRLRHNQTQTVRLRHRGRPEQEAEQAPTPAKGERGSETLSWADRPDSFLLLAVQRGATWSPMHAAFEPKPEDVAVALLYTPEQDEALRELQARGWAVAEPEAAEEGEPEDEAQPGGEPAGQEA